MRNIIGSPAEGEDFFERPMILAKLRRELDNQGNLLLVAPRRVGKTSLVLRLCEDWKKLNNRQAVYLNIEGRTNELAFAERLIEELEKNGLNPEFWTRAKGALTKLRQWIGGKGMKAPGLEVNFGEAGDMDHATLGKVLESVFRKIEESKDTVLIAIDELPVFLLALQKEEEGPKRVATFLHWLRELRQTYRKNIRWLFLGSIGLDHFVADQKLQKTTNDLQVVTLDAFSATEADQFLRTLATSNGLSLSTSQCEEIVRLIGWPLAYHLQLVIHELLDTESRVISEAYESLTKKWTHFDTWEERIDLQFSPVDAAGCKTILGHLCRHVEGRERGQILDVLMAKPSADAEKVDEQLSRLLLVLQHDGYLLEAARRYAFRSFLLRDYWHRKHVK